MRILITGGAGFVGSEVANSLRSEFPSSEVVALDNLRRRGSELNLNRLASQGVKFVHGDVRVRSDLESLEGNFDVMVEASAEPSVHAGLASDPAYLLDTNLVGTLNCLAFARRRVGRTIFLSTSRVYSIAPLRAIQLEDLSTRFEIAPTQTIPGVSSQGIDESFPTHLPRSLYGATKLASELLVQEYVAAYGIRAVSNRCGVIAGPGQFGRTEQGVVALWVARHYFGGGLQYTGFGGTGKQVRDVLHPADLATLLLRQIEMMDSCSGECFNVGGGRRNSVSLSELTMLCRDVTCREVSLGAVETTSPVDVPLYISDTTKAEAAFGWSPRRSVRSIVTGIHSWLREQEEQLRPLFA